MPQPSSDLFLAILAMDAYNRGDGAHINGLGTAAIGDATIGTSLQNNAASFFAQSYNWSGQKVISYRGTDSLTDVLTGWITGAGVYGPQVTLASSFYQSVTGKSIWDGPMNDVVLTGHSLGGGLAGLIASLTGDRATIFDSMPYTGAATLMALFKNIDLGIADPTVLFGNNPQTPLFPFPMTSQITSQYLSGEILTAIRAAGPAVAGAYAASLFGPALGTAVGSFVATYAALLAAQQNNPPALPAPGTSILDSFTLHSQSLLVISKWAQDNGHAAWAGAGKELFQAIVGNGNRIGGVLGLDGSTGNVAASSQLAEMIAYSALYNPGASNWNLVFGDTAIRALFDDTDALGSLLSGPNVSKTIKSSAQALADIALQFAGHLAKDKVVGANMPAVPVADGVLSLSTDRQTLSIDFSDELWSAGTGGTTAPVQIIGRTDLTNQVFAKYSGGPAGQPFGSDVGTGMKWLWSSNDARIIDRIVFATTDDALTTTLTDRGYSSPKVSIFAAAGHDDTITGSSDNNFIYGGDGKDTIRGGNGNDLLVGGEGEDRLSGGEGRDYLAGGEGKDTAFYDAAGSGVEVTIKGVTDEASDNLPTLEVSTSSTDIDRVKDVEVIELTDQKDTLYVGAGLATLSGVTLIDGKGQAPGERDIVDFSGSTTGISLKSTSSGAFYASRGSGLFGDLLDLFSGRVEYKHFEKVVLTSQNDTVNIRDSSDTRLMTIDMGDGNDTLYNAGQGSVIITGGGQDGIRFAHNIGIADLSAEDRITIGGIIPFFGGTRYKTSESEWASSYGGLFKSGINQDGELVVKAAGLGTIYILNWGASGGMSAPFEQRPGHISLFEYEMGAYKLVNGNWPSHMTLMGTWELLGAIVKVHFGVSIWGGVDPLVLDLDGDGLELMQRSTISPRFDVDGDLYAERTAWVRPDDGFLVRDLNGNGKIDDITEMFGGKTSGFSALATLDGNHDGKVDANDNGLVDFNGDGVIDDGTTDHDGDGVPDATDTIASILVWRDLDEDAVTDAGELFSLADLGIASLSVGGTPQQDMVVNGNQVTATGTFTRTDGTTGTMGDVLLNADNSSTQYTGGSIAITEDAAEQPDLKGFGTLVSLREAMSLEEDFIATVSATMAQMSSLSLNDLRAAVLPILAGWAMASPLGDGDRDPNTSAPKLNNHTDVPVLLATGPDGKQEVIDFAYQTSKTVTEVGGGQHVVHYWKLASGGVVMDANGIAIEFPTLAQLQATPHVNGTWNIFDGDLIGFTERYLGEELPIDKVMPEGEEPGPEAMALFNNILGIVDLTVARLVVQAGPLSSYFAGITYDPDGNGFTAAPGNERDLIPVFEAIFGTAVQGSHDAPWLAEWKPLLDIVIGDYSRGESYLLNTYGFLAENIVAAYENSGMTLVFTDVTTAFGIPSELVVAGSGVLTGSNDADIIYAGNSSNDVLRGGVGPDTYIFGYNIGHDTVDDVELASEAQVPDTMRFAQLAASDVTATRVGIDLILTVNATGETITVTGQFTGHQPGLFGGNLLEDRGVGEIIFADGTVWDALEIAKAVRHPESTSDTLQGTRAIDYLDGGAGDDVLLGGNDGDHYFFDAGYGHDRVQDGMTDILVDTPDFVEFGSGITKDNVTFKHIGDTGDLRVTIAGNETDELTITGQFSAAYTGVFGTEWFDRIEIFSFSDGTYYTWVDVIEMVIANEQTIGDDTVYGFSYTDTLDGGAGNDYLSGHNESDTYIFGRGYGHDTVHDDMGSILASDTDVVVFKDATYADVTFQRIGNSEDFSIQINGTDDVLTVQGEFKILYGLFNVATDRIEQFKFSDGTILSWEDIIHNFNAAADTDGNDVIHGFNYADTLAGGLGDDVLQGGREDDTYVYTRGDGNDTIIEVADAQTSAFDTLALHGIAPSSVSLIRDGNDIILAIAESVSGAGDGGSVRLKDEGNNFFSTGLERILFDDATVWTQDGLRLMLIAQASTSGNDTIAGFNTNDTFRGGAGDDALAGNAGNDTYIYARGDGHDVITELAGEGVDTLTLEGLNPSDVSLVRNGNHLTLVMAESTSGAGDGGSILLSEELDNYFNRGVETIQFSNGTTWNQNDLRLILLAQASTAGNDTIMGFNVSDTLSGGVGDDTIYGREGDDIYIYARGDGHDVVTDDAGAGFDTLMLEGLEPSAVNLARIGNDVRVIIAETAPGAGDGGSILLKNGVNDWFNEGVEQIKFADGTIWSRADIRTKLISAAGTPGDDEINGSTSSDIIAGGQGNDTINGNAGADIYIYNRGDGNDVITDGPGDPVIDTLALIGISPAQVSLVRNGIDLTFVIAESAAGAGDGGSILLKDELDDWYNQGIDQVAFADGTIWSRADLRVMVLAQASTSGNDTINGFNSSDVLQGGVGNDTLNGGSSADTYIYTRGDGNDVITDGADAGSADKLILNGIAPSDVSLVRNGNHVTLVIAESSPGVADGGSIQLQEELDWWYDRGVDQIVFDDGTVWGPANLRAMLIAQAATEGDDLINGFAASDVISGGHGDDFLFGRGGSDTFVFTRGDGIDVIDNQIGSTTNKLVLHDIDPADVSIVRNATNAIFLFGDAGVDGRVTIQGQFGSGGKITTIEFDDGVLWTDQTILANAVPNDGSTVTHYGSVGVDDISGTAEGDIIDGRSGADTLRGGNAGDTYLYGAGSGNDSVVENAGDTGVDRIKLSGLNAVDLEWSRQGNDLHLKILASGETLKVANQFSGTSGIEQITFADNTSWDRSQIQAAAWIIGTSAGENISGSAMAETIDGRGGNDNLNGGGGGDTYLYGVGSGTDVITESSADTGTDVVKLVGLNASDVVFGRSGNNLLVQINSTGETLTVYDHFFGTSGIEQILFADGSSWNRSQIQSAAWIFGTAAGETINGSTNAETIDGKGGNDNLNGAGGGDTYIYAAGYGSDLITEGTSDGTTDVVKLVGLNASDVLFSRSGNNLVIRINSTGEMLTVHDQFFGTSGVEQVVFADGMTWDRSQIQSAAWFRGTAAGETINGSANAETIDGKGGNDNLNGGAGGDSYIYAAGYGNDLITEGTSDGTIDVVRLVGLNASDVLFSRSSNNLVIQINSTGETLTVHDQFFGTSGVEQVVFANGTTWDRSQIQSAAWFRGTAAGETINGSANAETIDGKGGNDNLNGGAGGDTYIYAAGYGNDRITEGTSDGTTDVVKLVGLNASDVLFSRSGNNLLVQINSTGETLTVHDQFFGTSGIEQILFADNTSWDRTEIANAAWYRGTPGNDSIQTSSVSDTLVGNQGNDYLRGNGGSDTYVYFSGHGNDEIDDESGSVAEVDTLKFGDLNATDVTLSRVGDHLFVGINPTGEALKIDYQFSSQSNNWGIENFQFANGEVWNLAAINANAWYRGTSGNDVISGSAWDDTIAGGAGNDTMSGASGNDTFVFRANLGQDVITDFTVGSDVLEFRDGIFSDAAAALAAATASGNSTLITLDAGNSVLLQNVTLASLNTGDFHIV